MQGLLNFSGRGFLPVIRQTEAAECGLACLAMVAFYHGHRTDMNSLRRRYAVSLKGVTLRDLMEIAAHLGLACRPLRIEVDHLGQLRLPAILHWDMDHFVVLKACKKHGIVVHDPAAGEKWFPITEASRHLTGVVLELSPTEEFCRTDQRVRLPFSAFWSGMRGNSHVLTQILVLSVVIEILILAAPFYMQLTVDEVIARGDVDLLLVLGLGFGLLVLIKVASTATRSFIVLLLQNTLSFQIGARLFHHLVRLPLSFFEKRHIGDILSRFGSIEPIRNMLAEGLITGLIDGLMSVLMLGLMFAYSVQLGFIVLFAFALYAALRLALFRMFRQRSEAAIHSKAQENSNFIETVRAVQSLKLLNRENERESQWLNRYAEYVNANVRLGRARISFKAINDTIYGLENVITIYLAARLALDNLISVGMIFAFVSYKLQFAERTALLIEKLVELRILGLHLERLADIALTPLERGHDQDLSYVRPILGSIELRNVCFRYAEAEPLILNNVNLSVAPGQFVTIMGPSGCGKTTLVKIMLGLLEPTSGEVLIDGLPLGQIGPRVYREHIGAVMQEDQLLSGSIADNICFFETTFDRQWMIECAQIAGIHDVIMAMPMSYNSLIGDMGSSLSSGQKQRILLARALYRRPKILFLDEGTAHLDTEKEKEINANLQHLNMTRVSIAHRPEIAHGADMIIRLPAAAQPSQVGVIGRRPAAAPARDAGHTGFAAEGAKSTKLAQGHDGCSDDGRKGDNSKHAGKSDYSKGGKGECSKQDGDWKDAMNCQPQKDYCNPKLSNDCGKGDMCRNPGEALAKLDLSHGDFGSRCPDHSGDMQGSARPSGDGSEGFLRVAPADPARSAGRIRETSVL
ncbi:peptidase domain-containing ABC transporter [Bradyrhizobium sp. WSM 1738]|uniref:peptidase domain-containing ABC transporter n=1 Tax=Bradyrhizobium hereditatis TaxID=2821405 RepID=UPI001CE29700|nr:peptidase domain-containing ABC transporter [Bradyrhizobium hereditatis]MCA6117360.1 peptidase domain-containing ABC transporter [Bradyrhizobium hereditatis]